MKEGIVLALLGGSAGVLAAHWGIAAVIASAPVEIPRLAEVSVDWIVLGFCLAVTTAAGLVTSIPALRYRSFSVQEHWREAQATATSSFHHVRSRGVLVAFEIALSSILLCAASLMGVSFFKLVSVEKGFTPASILSFDIALSPQPYPDDESRVNFNAQLLERLAAQPGVRPLGLTTKMPLEGSDWVYTISPSDANWSQYEALPTNSRFVSSAYWQAMRIPLLAGRLLEPSDRGHRVSVVSEETAHRMWPGESPIGKRYLGGPGQNDEPYEVVGLVSDVRTTGLEE
jgi:putative ABC transport system permease protein